MLLMINPKVMIGLLAICIVVSGSAFAGDLPEKDVVAQKDVIPEAQGTSAIEPVLPVNFDELNKYEKEMLIVEMLGRWVDMSWWEKVEAIGALATWAGAWAALFIFAAPVTIPAALIMVLLFFMGNLFGPMALADIIL